MTDSQGETIKAGNTLERIKPNKAGIKAPSYNVVSYKWNDDDKEESLVADAGFIKERLDPMRAKEFKITGDKNE